MFFFCTKTKRQASLLFDLLEQVLASNVNTPEGKQMVKTPLGFSSTSLCWTMGKSCDCVRDELAALNKPSGALILPNRAAKNFDLMID